MGGRKLTNFFKLYILHNSYIVDVYEKKRIKKWFKLEKC